jgi:hypothetical protein
MEIVKQASTLEHEMEEWDEREKRKYEARIALELKQTKEKQEKQGAPKEKRTKLDFQVGRFLCFFFLYGVTPVVLCRSPYGIRPFVFHVGFSRLVKHVFCI